MNYTSLSLGLKAFCAVLLLLMAGCSSVGSKKPFFEEMDSKTKTSPSEMVRNVGQADRASDRASSVKIDPGAWVAGTPIKVQTVPRLPSVFYDEISFNRHITSLYDFSARVTDISKLRVVARTDAVRVAAQAIQEGVAPMPGLTAAMGGAGNSLKGGEKDSGQTKTLHIMYRGSLKGLLDTVASRLGVYWSFNGVNVQFFLTETRTFALNAPTGDVTITAGMQTNSTSSGGNTGGGATSGVNTNSQLTLWSDVEKNIKTFLSPLGSVNHSKATGTFSVTDIPDVFDRIENYMQTLNKELARQIVFEVNVYAVSLTRDDTKGLDISGVLTQGSSKITLTPVVGGGGTIAIANTNGADSINFFIEALSTAGATRKVTTASIVASNNHPVPLQVGTQFSYISNQQTTMSQVGTTQTTSTVSQLNTGLTLMLMPRIVDENNILLQFTLGLTSLKNLRTYSTSISRLEMPELETRNILQRVNLRSGETLIVSGFEDGMDRQGGTGFVEASNPLFGQQKQSGTREVFVITVKPSELAYRF